MRLRELRKSAGLSMKELGKIFDIAESTVSLYERSLRQPDYATIAKFSQYFNVSIDYLLGNSDHVKTSLHDDPITSAQEKELLSLFAQLTEAEKKVIDEQIQFILSRRQ